MESLGKIFGSNSRVKIMRLFLFNETSSFDLDDITHRCRVKKSEARKEVTMLAKIGFLKKKTFSKKVLIKSKKKDTKPKYKKINSKGWLVDTRHELVRALNLLLLDSRLINEKDIVFRIKKAGKIKLLVLSGLFVGNDNRKLDMLVVGKNIKKAILEKEVAIIESEIGTELKYSFFEQKEYEYRMSMYDKLLRDMMDNENIQLINNLKK